MLEKRQLSFKDRFVIYLMQILSDRFDDYPTMPDLPFTDMTTRLPITFNINQEEYTHMYSALAAGAELIFPSISHELRYIFEVPQEAVMTCEQIIDCIENDADTATALQQWLSDNGYSSSRNSGTPNEPSIYDSNPLILDGSTIEDCDNDNLFGAITQIVDFINRRIVDVFEQIEAESNFIERTQIALEAFPITDGIGGDTAAQIADQILEELVEGYNAAFTEELEDEYRCDLFCLVKDTCELDFHTFSDYFSGRIGATPPEDAFAEYIEWFITGSFVGTQIVDAAYALVCAALAYGSDAMGIKIGTLLSAFNSALNDPNSDWTTLCEDCGVDQFVPIIDHNTPCAVAGQSCGTIISNPSLNVWRIASTHRSEGNDEGATIADELGRTFKITGATKVSGADITFSTRANPACATTSAAGLNLNNNIVNIIYVAPNTASWEYEFTFELV